MSAPLRRPSRPAASVRLTVFALLGTLLVGVRAGRADDPDPEVAYRKALKRPSLAKRMAGRIAFAKSGSPNALPLLVEDYLKAEEPKDQVRYLIATLASETLTTTKENAAVFASWRDRAKTPTDAWLWNRALSAETSLESRAAYDVARDPIRPAILRAAALHTLITSTDDERLRVVAEVLDKLPKEEPDRSVLLEACAAVASGWAPYLKDEAPRAIVERIAKTLDDPSWSIDVKDVVARRLATLFRTDVLGGDSAPWIRELNAAAVRVEGAEAPETKYAPGPFFGLRAIGRRVVYVIDVSDSMLEPLSPPELKALRPTTPGDSGGPPSKGPKDPRPKASDPEEPLPWQKIKNRLDAAREVLKRSLRAMKPNQSVCVVLFGDLAKTLAATPQLVPVEPKTIAAAIAELDKLAATPAPGDKSKPYGKLMGETNLHGGIRLGFRMTTKGRITAGEYVDLSKTGCDAMFVLSDGVPSTDDFKKAEKREEGEETVKDRESMEKVAPTAQVIHVGPYGDPYVDGFSYLTDDVRRMNLFRQAEIHCVALGEASDAILRTIAEYGGGRFVRFGD